MANKIIDTIKGAGEAFENYYKAGVGNIKNMMLRRQLKKIKEERMNEEIHKEFKKVTGRSYRPQDEMGKDTSLMRKIEKELKDKYK
jgi:Ca2+-binding EF-hand superfamily protein